MVLNWGYMITFVYVFHITTLLHNSIIEQKLFKYFAVFKNNIPYIFTMSTFYWKNNSYGTFWLVCEQVTKGGQKVNWPNRMHPNI